MKNVIVLLLILNLGCSFEPAPNPLSLELPKPNPVSAMSFSIHIDGNSFFYKNKEIDRKEIKPLIQKFKNDNKENRKIVMGIQPKSSAKNEAVIFLMDLAQREGLDAILEVDD